MSPWPDALAIPYDSFCPSCLFFLLNFHTLHRTFALAFDPDASLQSVVGWLRSGLNNEDGHCGTSIDTLA
jgi:hypothetical protein